MVVAQSKKGHPAFMVTRVRSFAYSPTLAMLVKPWLTGHGLMRIVSRNVLVAPGKELLLTATSLVPVSQDIRIMLVSDCQKVTNPKAGHFLF